MFRFAPIILKINFSKYENSHWVRYYTKKPKKNPTKTTTNKSNKTL